MDREAIRLALIDGAGDLQLTEKQVDQLVEYLALMVKWNKVYNLTAIRDPFEMVYLHILDALTVLSHVKRKAPGRLLDVGAGAGLPSIPLAICLPELKVFAVDKVQKKVSFMQQVKSELGLKSFIPKHGRIEQMEKKIFDPLGIDIVISRAFSSLEDFVGLTQHLLSEGGVWFAMKGVIPTEEMGVVEGCEMKVHPLELSGKAVERHLVEIIEL